MDLLELETQIIVFYTLMVDLTSELAFSQPMLLEYASMKNVTLLPPQEIPGQCAFSHIGNYLLY